MYDVRVCADKESESCASKHELHCCSCPPGGINWLSEPHSLRPSLNTCCCRLAFPPWPRVPTCQRDTLASKSTARHGCGHANCDHIPGQHAASQCPHICWCVNAVWSSLLVLLTISQRAVFSIRTVRAETHVSRHPPGGLKASGRRNNTCIGWGTTATSKVDSNPRWWNLRNQMCRVSVELVPSSRCALSEHARS